MEAGITVSSVYDTQFGLDKNIRTSNSEEKACCDLVDSGMDDKIKNRVTAELCM